MPSYRHKCLRVYGHECLFCEGSENRQIEVHHINGDRNNNHITNLIPVCVKHHNDIHYSKNGLSKWNEMLTHTTYNVEVDDDLWEEYKDTVPRTTDLQDPIIDFIEDRVEAQHSDYTGNNGESNNNE